MIRSWSLRQKVVNKGHRHVLHAAAVLTLSALPLQAATLIHQFDLDSSLDDSLGTGVTLTVHPNTSTHGIDAEGWMWTATSHPGGGLILTTGYITNPLDYSLGFRVQFNQVTSGGGGGGSPYRKLVSFRGPTDDNGLYFWNAQLVFYPFGVSTAITYSADTFYDFVFSRSASDNTIRVYVMEADGSMAQVYEESDPGEAAVPIDTGGGEYQFMLFMDDDATSSEWTSGGICKSIRVWNGPLSQEEIANALLTVECEDDADCDEGNLCTTGSCVAGECVFTVVECPERQMCDPDTGECVECPVGCVQICGPCGRWTAVCAVAFMFFMGLMKTKARRYVGISCSRRDG